MIESKIDLLPQMNLELGLVGTLSSLFGESNFFIKQKILALLKFDLFPVQSSAKKAAETVVLVVDEARSGTEILLSI
jgi:hypothetical protein